MKTIKILAFIFIGFIVLIIGFSVISAIVFSDTEPKTIESLENNSLDEPIKSLWTYSERIDEMDGKTDYFAQIKSENELNFAFPYNGGSKGYISIRNMDGENSVSISMDKGQFMTNFEGSEYLRIKFDDEELENYTYGGAADGRLNYIFPLESEKLISKIKKAKRVKIEAPFFNEGRKVFDFNTEGLVWDK